MNVHIKRLLALLLTLAMLAGTVPAVLAAEPDAGTDPNNNPFRFDDVQDASQYYYEPVYWAVDRQVTNGTSASTFSPDAGCTRAQVVALLWRAAGRPEPTSRVYENPFKDVRTGVYFYKAMLWAIGRKITTGTGETRFSPDEICTRGQSVTFLWRYFGEPEPAGTANLFADVPAGQYYSKAVLWAVEQGITNGTSPATFRPEAPCTRGQIVTFLWRAFGGNAA